MAYSYRLSRSIRHEVLAYGLACIDRYLYGITKAAEGVGVLILIDKREHMEISFG